MRDEEIEAILLEARPRCLANDDRRQVLESILAAGGQRSRAWWQRPVPLWKAAAVLVSAVVISWIGASVRSEGTANDVAKQWADTAAYEDSTSVCRTYECVDPTVFRGERKGATRDGDVTTWRVISNRNAVSCDKEIP